MPNSQSKANPKHLKGFWPIFIIVVVAIVAGGIILSYASGNTLEDNIDSTSIISHFEVHKAPVKKTAPRPAVAP